MMNEKIKELAEQASDIARQNNPYWSMSDEFPEDKIWIEKFAELIVKECAQVCRDQPDIYALKADRDNCAIAIENHFGVE